MKKFVLLVITLLGIVGSIASIISYCSSIKTSEENPVDNPPFRVSYYRMKGIAPNFLIRGMLSPEWEKLLGGQQEIVNNIVLNSASSVLDAFADDPFGDIVYSENDFPVSFSEHLDLRSYSKKISKDAPTWGKSPRADEQWKTFLGGRYAYKITIPDIKAINTVLNTNRWPENYKLYHTIINTGKNQIQAPVIWRYLRVDDLLSYYQDIREYYKAAFKDMNDMNLNYYVQKDAKVIEGLRYITRNGLPEGFMLIEGYYAAHGGWELYAFLRDIELEVVVIENISKKAINIGNLHYKELNANYLRPYLDSGAMFDNQIEQKKNIYPAGKLLPGEKIVIPTRIHFTYPDKIYRMDYGVFENPEYSSIDEHQNEILFIHPDNISEHLFYKERKALKENIPPQLIRRVDYGPAWKLLSLEINNMSFPIRSDQFNNFNLYFSNEKGSCPFVYTKESNKTPWLSEGHMLLGATSLSSMRSEKKKLKYFSSEIQIRENEDEVSFIESIYIEVLYDDNKSKILYPNKRFYKTNKFDVITRGNPIVYNFDTGKIDGPQTVFLHLRGYYKPFSQISFLKDVVKK